MSRRSEVLLWGAQRISAMLLAVCVIVHLVRSEERRVGKEC